MKKKVVDRILSLIYSIFLLTNITFVITTAYYGRLESSIAWFSATLWMLLYRSADRECDMYFDLIIRIINGGNSSRKETEK